MKLISVILLIICAVCIASGEAAIAAFCGVLGACLLFIPSTSKKEEKPPVRSQTPQPARKRAPKKPSHNQKNIQVPGAPAVDAYAFHGSQKDYFYYLLSRSFPAYAVQIDVSPEHLSGSSFNTMETVSEIEVIPTAYSGSVPVTFLLCRDGAPKLAILLGGRNDRDTAPYRQTEDKLHAMGIPVQYYINTFRNKASYVYSRVSEALN